MVYMASADWMERNFFRRIEVCVPILSNPIRRRVISEGLRSYLRDNVRRWEMDSDGKYHLVGGRGKNFSAHDHLVETVAHAPVKS
jgi:polyphosphate kinase